MAEDKRCVTCGRSIPAAEPTCRYCGASQIAQLKPTAVIRAVREGAAAPPEAARSQVDAVASAVGSTQPARTTPASGGEAAGGTPARRPAGHRSQTDNTIIHFEQTPRVVACGHDGSASDRAAAPPGIATHGRAQQPAAVAGRAASVWTFPVLSRAVMVLAGAVLLVVFGMNHSLLAVLGGNHLILEMYYLVGGMVLLGGALLPLPGKVRAGLATLAGAVPLFIAPPLVELDGWRGLAAALVVLLLPGALLLRARLAQSAVSRVLVGGAVAITALIYVVPAQGVVPVGLAVTLMGTGSIDHVVVGLITLLPLALAVATLTVFLPGSSTGYGNLWACLVLAAASGAVLIAGLAGTPMDVSLVHLGVCLLAAGGAAAVGVAELLDLDSQVA